MARRAGLVVLGTLVALLVASTPLPALALSSPRTLAQEHRLGRLDGRARPIDPPFSVGYLGLSWISGGPPSARFLIDGSWTAWSRVPLDEIPSSGGRTYSALVAGRGADSYQVRGSDRAVRAVAINTADGPRRWTLRWEPLRAQASHIAEPAVISRSAWGADESLRFNPDGSEKWPPAFYATQKLIVHHTAGQNDDPDPAATVRAIYYYHAITRGWGDIGYNFLVDAQGRTYKGRYSGPAGTLDQDSTTGEDPAGLGVTAAHTSGWNSGTMGIAILGTYTSVSMPAAARAAVVEHLAWESEHHGLDPLATSAFTNPVSGAQATNPNISGHRDWVATECPGDLLYAELPAIRQDVAARVLGSPVPQTRSYAPTSVAIMKGSAVGDPLANLAADDGAYYRVDAVKSSGKYVVNWRASVSVDAASVQRLSVSYDGSHTASVTQSLFIYNFSTGVWDRFARAQVSTTDSGFGWSTGGPAAYVSPTGEVRARAHGTGVAAYTNRADLWRFTLESQP